MKNHHAENVDKHHSSFGTDRIDSSGYTSRMKFGVIAFFCLLSIVGNIATSFLASALHAPIFLDTVFTVAITFYAGLVPGLIVAVLHNPIMTFIRYMIYGTDLFYFGSLYAVCGMALRWHTIGRMYGGARITGLTFRLTPVHLIFPLFDCSVFYCVHYNFGDSDQQYQKKKAAQREPYIHFRNYSDTGRRAKAHQSGTARHGKSEYKNAPYRTKKIFFRDQRHKRSLSE